MAADGKGAADHAQVHIDLPSDDPSAKLLKDLLDEYKKVNKKPEKPVPTGIKPRGEQCPGPTSIAAARANAPHNWPRTSATQGFARSLDKASDTI